MQLVIGPGRRARSWITAHPGDCVAVGFLCLVVFCYFAPGLKDGAYLAPADIGRSLSTLTGLVHAVPNHNDINGDVITQGLPWYQLNWQLVHAGEFPLWNGLTGNGLPQFLNFESGTLALPSLIGYLFPLSVAFLVTLAIKLLIAGIGSYVFCRLCRAGPLAACMGGVTFMLSGQLTGWLGWSISGVFCWVGFIAAGCLVAYRADWRARRLLALAVPVAFAIYGGFPEGYVIIAVTLGIFLVVTGIWMLGRAIAVDLAGVMRIAVGTVLGALLAAPLWLPGISVVTDSVRRANTSAGTGIPTSMASLVFAQGYDGLPTEFHPAPGAVRFFGQLNYYETAAYVGALALVFALVALLIALRRPIVAGLGALGLASVLIAYRIGNHDPVQRLVAHLGVRSIDLNRVLAMLGFAVACLAAIGLQEVVDRYAERRVHLAVLGALVAGVVIDAALASSDNGVASAYRADRLRSLLWPTISIVVLGALVVALIVVRSRPSPRARLLELGPPALVLVQSAALLFAGVGLNSYAQSAFPETPAVAQLQRIVGTDLVGLDAGNVSCPVHPLNPYCGVKGWSGDGFYPEINIGYGVDELALHDPVIPSAVYSSWPIANAGQELGGTNLFVPDIDTVALAQRYGVSYVLVAPNLAAPLGMDKVATLAAPLGTSTLYRVPGSARFTFSGGEAQIVSVTQSDDADYTLRVSVKSPSELNLAITAITGWNLSANGRAVPLSVNSADLLEAAIPAGTTSLVLSYWPHRLTGGIFLAAIALVVLAVLGLWGRPQVRRLMSPRRPPPLEHIDERI